MTSPLQNLIDELENLEKEATPGRWDYSDHGVYTLSEFIKTFDGKSEVKLVAPSIAREDEKFICASRNALPALLKIIKRQREALEFYAKGHGVNMSIDCEVSLVLHEDGCPFHKVPYGKGAGLKARQTLSDCDKIAEGVEGK